MVKRGAAVLLVCACAAAQLGTAAHSAELKKWRVISEKTVTGFVFPESVAYDPKARVLYVSEFGGTKLAPAEKDGQTRNGLTVFIPDLPASQVRIVRLGH